MSTGVELISEERKRQIEQEGWTTQHDDQLKSFELSRAACAYLNASSNDLIRKFWPFGWRYWRPKSQLRNLVRAGALVAAEIDRLLRAGEIE